MSRQREKVRAVSMKLCSCASRWPRSCATWIHHVARRVQPPLTEPRTSPNESQSKVAPVNVGHGPRGRAEGVRRRPRAIFHDGEASGASSGRGETWGDRPSVPRPDASPSPTSRRFRRASRASASNECCCGSPASWAVRMDAPAPTGAGPQTPGHAPDPPRTPGRPRIQWQCAPSVLSPRLLTRALQTDSAAACCPSPRRWPTRGPRDTRFGRRPVRGRGWGSSRLRHEIEAGMRTMTPRSLIVDVRLALHPWALFGRAAPEPPSSGVAPIASKGMANSSRSTPDILKASASTMSSRRKSGEDADGTLCVENMERPRQFRLIAM